MKDIRIKFGGSEGASILLDKKVEDKSLTEQKVLVNIATERGSDQLYDDRGTELLAKAVSGAIVNTNDAIHAGNFAALDTIRFVTTNYPEDDLTQGGRSLLDDLNITALRMKDGVVSYSAQLEFTDGTSTDIIEAQVALS